MMDTAGDAIMAGLVPSLQLAAATLRVATPLVLAAFAGLFCERAGIADIALEGKMLAGAFVAAAVASLTGNPWLGLAAAAAAGVTLALLHGFACITHHGNQVVSGMAINILAAGLAPTLATAWFRLGGQTPLLPATARLPSLHTGGTAAGYPDVSSLFSVLDGTNVLVAVAAVVVLATGPVLERTRFGLRLRAVGENPAAVDTAGISVAGLRYRALLITGVLAGMAGACLSIGHGAGFVRDMSAGKGYLALAALVFGKWRPWPVLGACLLFALADAVQLRLQGVALPWVGEIPVQFVQALPYVLTVLLLAGFVGRAVAPRAIGVPYIKER
jgi:simple sugar transport system permease protein